MQVNADQMPDGADIQPTSRSVTANPFHVKRLAGIRQASCGNAFHEAIIVVDVKYNNPVPPVLGIVADARLGHIQVPLQWLLRHVLGTGRVAHTK